MSKIKKPEKRCNPEGVDRPIDYGYNLCWDEREKWLPSEEEILGIIKNPPMEYPIFQEREQPIKIPIWSCNSPEFLAKAISKRLRGE